MPDKEKAKDLYTYGLQATADDKFDGDLDKALDHLLEDLDNTSSTEHVDDTVLAYEQLKEKEKANESPTSS